MKYALPITVLVLVAVSVFLWWRSDSERVGLAPYRNRRSSFASVEVAVSSGA